MHSRREDAFKEGLGGIQEELMWTNKKSRIVLYYIDANRFFIVFSNEQLSIIITQGVVNSVVIFPCERPKKISNCRQKSQTC